MIAQKVDRRNFLKAGAATAGGLLLGFYLPGRGRLKAAQTSAASKLNAFVHIGSDDTVTLFIHMAEMGQGTVTSLSMLLAEELECDWNRIRTEFPGVDRAFGPLQGVFGSRSIRTSWEPLRRAGASAREMLIAAAAKNWGVDKAECRAENGVVINARTNARLSYGKLAEAAAEIPVPANVTLKDPKQFRLIGTSPKRLDTPGKVDGRTLFGIDVRLPGMQYAVIARCPVFGGKVASFDAAKAKAVEGVKQVVAISNGVAVVADNTWSAMEGRRASASPMGRRRECQRQQRRASGGFLWIWRRSRAPRRERREISKRRLAGAAKKIEAVYEAPYLAHAPDGASELCRACASRRLRGLGVHPNPDCGARRGCQGDWSRAGKSAGAHYVPGWRFRAPWGIGLYRRGGGSGQGGGSSGES